MVSPLDQAYKDPKPILLGWVWRLIANTPSKMGTLTMSLKYPKTGSRKPSNSLTIKNVTPIPQYSSQILRNKIRLGIQILENIKRQQERLEENEEFSD